MGKRRSLRQGGKDESLSDNDEDFEQEERETLTEGQIESIKTRKKLIAKRRTIGSDGQTPPINPFSAFGGFKGLNASTTNTEPLATSTQKPLSQQKPSLPKIEDAKKLISSVVSEAASPFISSKNEENGSLTEKEAKFIQELSIIYAKYFDTQRDYKLPNYDKALSNKENYAKMLMDLNKRCAKWISKNVEETQDQVLNLTPIFIDYFNYLIKLENEFFPKTSKKEETKNGHATFETKINGNRAATNSEIIITKKIEAPKQTPITTTTDWSSGGLMKFKPTVIEQPKPTTTTPNFSFNNTITPNSTSQIFTLGTKKDEEKKAQLTVESPFSFGKKQTEETAPKMTFNSSNTTFSFGKKDEEPAKIETATPLFSFGKKPEEPAKIETATPLFSLFFEETPTKKLEEVSKLTGFSTTPFSFAPKKDDTTVAKKPETATGSLDSFQSTSKTEAPSSASVTTTASSGGFFSFLNNKTETTSSETGTASTTTTTSTAQSGGFFSILNTNSNSTSSTGTFGNLKPFTGFGNIGSFGSASSSGGFSFATQPIKTLSGDGDGGEGGADEENYEPPKPEFEEVKEEGSVYSKSIKLFYFNKKENKYSNRGAGNLHLKSLNNGEKTQLIVRADTSLGNILLNVNLNKSIPISKISNKDISIICVANPAIPTIDAQEPCKFLFRVKSEEEANELLDKLNSMKK